MREPSSELRAKTSLTGSAKVSETLSSLILPVSDVVSTSMRRSGIRNPKTLSQLGRSVSNDSELPRSYVSSYRAHRSVFYSAENRYSSLVDVYAIRLYLTIILPWKV